MTDIYQKICETGIIPVIKIDDAENAVPLAKALIDGGLSAAEITLRTAADAIKSITTAYPDKVVAAGTVLTTEQTDAAKAAGADTNSMRIQKRLMQKEIIRQFTLMLTLADLQFICCRNNV